MGGFIDIHHHFFPPDLDKAKASANSGWRTPEENLPWTPELSIRTMNSMGIQASILSFPAFPSGEISAENRVLARSKNDYVANICRQYPARFGFFATLPFLDDVQGTHWSALTSVWLNLQLGLIIGVLKEIAYALDTIGADGISISSSYGEGASSSEFAVSTKSYTFLILNRLRRWSKIWTHLGWAQPTSGRRLSSRQSNAFFSSMATSHTWLTRMRSKSNTNHASLSQCFPRFQMRPSKQLHI